MSNVNNINTMRVTHSLAMSQELTGAMICIQGAALGSMLSLRSDVKVLIGRDASVCDYVVADPRVSRKHMEITYVGALNQYCVVDCSSNGTFVQDGKRLSRQKEYYLMPGTELCFGQGNNRYKLK